MNSIPCKDKLPNAIGQNGAAKAKTLEAQLKKSAFGSKFD